MTKISETNQVRIKTLRGDFLKFKALEAELTEKALAKVEAKLAPERNRISSEITALYNAGVPARVLGTEVLGTKAYVTYMEYIDDTGTERVTRGRESAEFIPVEGGGFDVVLRYWGDQELSGTARFDENNFNTDIENEVGNYVEQALFVNHDDEELEAAYRVFRP